MDRTHLYTAFAAGTGPGVDSQVSVVKKERVRRAHRDTGTAAQADAAVHDDVPIRGVPSVAAGWLTLNHTPDELTPVRHRLPLPTRQNFRPATVPHSLGRS